MPSLPANVDPQSLAEAIAGSGGPRVEPVWRPVGGGCIHCSGSLGSDPVVFVKTNSGDQLDNFQCEAEGLRALADSGEVNVPDVLAIGTTREGTAFLALEWIDLVARDSRSDAALGSALARLHQCAAPDPLTNRFGWSRANHLGASRQLNDPRDRWADFFRECRLRPQLQWLHASPPGCTPDIDAVLRACDTLLKDHEPEPSLLHGDLWSGNAAAERGTNNPILFDPAVYVGDAETDLAFSRMFGGFSQAFYRAYHEVRSPAAGHESRTRLYNLYHWLNHANLFGGSYIEQARSEADHLIRSVA